LKRGRRLATLLLSSDAWQPSILAQALLLLLAYGILIWRTGLATVPKWRLRCFVAGCLVFFIAFGSPIDYLSDTRLFSAHMLEHILETMVMTPLLMLGLPSQWIHRAMSVHALKRIALWVTNPIFAAAVYNVVFGLFHLPALYGLTLRNDGFHLLEHSIFFVTAFFLWWPVLGMHEDVHSLAPGWKLLYLLLNYNLMMPVSILFVVMQHPLYNFYVTAPRTFGLSPLADQQLSGFTMIVGMFIPYLWTGIRSYNKMNVMAWLQ